MIKSSIIYQCSIIKNGNIINSYFIILLVIAVIVRGHHQHTSLLYFDISENVKSSRRIIQLFTQFEERHASPILNENSIFHISHTISEKCQLVGGLWRLIFPKRVRSTQEHLRLQQTEKSRSLTFGRKYERQ